MSKLNEIISRPPTLSLSTRVDMRHLATLSRFWTSCGEQPRSISELTRLSLEGLAEMLASSGMVTMVQTQEEATNILDGQGMLSGGAIQKRNLLKAIMREGNVDLSTLSTPSNPAPTIERRVSPPLSFNLQEAEDRLHQMLSNDLTDKTISTHIRKDDLRDLAIRPDDPKNIREDEGGK